MIFTPPADTEASRFSRRFRRYAQVGHRATAIAGRIARDRLVRERRESTAHADALAEAFGNLKGPLMKSVQLLAAIPGALPAPYREALEQLQARAPAMGSAFVSRRMRAELGPHWRARFQSFEMTAFRAASLGQVHRARLHDGRHVVCKLQYPEMASAVDADIRQIRTALSLMRPWISFNTQAFASEIAARLREELNYIRESAVMRIFHACLRDRREIAVPQPIDAFSTERLLVMDALHGTDLMRYARAPLAVRNRIAQTLFQLWWQPFYGYGILHADAHPGNFSVFGGTADAERDCALPLGVNLYDFGCVRLYKPRFVQSVVALHAALRQDRTRDLPDIYEMWGFDRLDAETIEALNVWARFLFLPLLEDRTFTFGSLGNPAQFGLKQMQDVRNRLRGKPRVRIPPEFVFLDRSAVALGSILINLRAEVNVFRQFSDVIDQFSPEGLAERQNAALQFAGRGGEFIAGFCSGIPQEVALAADRVDGGGDVERFSVRSGAAQTSSITRKQDLPD